MTNNLTTSIPDIGVQLFGQGKVRLTFAPQTYPGDRMVLMLGNHKIGAVFPPAVASDKTDRHPWVWRLWGLAPVRDGRSKTELGAKNALIGVAKTWLQQAWVA